MKREDMNFCTKSKSSKMKIFTRYETKNTYTYVQNPQILHILQVYY